MALSLLCLSNISSIKVASYSLTFAFITFFVDRMFRYSTLKYKKESLINQTVMFITGETVFDHFW